MVISMTGLAGLRARRRRRMQQGRSGEQVLQGQCCDRLRPSFLGRRLEQILPLHTAAGAALVDWRWDSVSKRVSGVVLEDNQLRPFRWWPGLNHFELRGATLQIRPLG
jgi:hypothetical protein